LTGRSIALFVAAAFAEIGGAYLVWLGIKDHKGVAFVALGAMALTAYGILAAFQPSHEFGRVLAAYGGVFIVGALLWAIALDGFRPDRFDLLGAGICLVGVAVIMYAR
jgi:small multidrug resistance family-3 protein